MEKKPCNKGMFCRDCKESITYGFAIVDEKGLSASSDVLCPGCNVKDEAAKNQSGNIPRKELLRAVEACTLSGDNSKINKVAFLQTLGFI